MRPQDQRNLHHSGINRATFILEEQGMDNFRSHIYSVEPLAPGFYINYNKYIFTFQGWFKWDIKGRSHISKKKIMEYMNNKSSIVKRDSGNNFLNDRVVELVHIEVLRRRGDVGNNPILSKFNDFKTTANY